MIIVKAQKVPALYSRTKKCCEQKKKKQKKNITGKEEINLDNLTKVLEEYEFF